MTKLVASSIDAIEQIVGRYIISILVLTVSLTISSTHDYSPVGGNMQLNLSTTTEVRIIKRSSVSALKECIGANKSKLGLRQESAVIKKYITEKFGITTEFSIERHGKLCPSARKKEMQLFCFAGLTKLVVSSMIAREQIVGRYIISILVLTISLTISSTHFSQF